jgi:hypothetical protein
MGYGSGSIEERYSVYRSAQTAAFAILERFTTSVACGETEIRSDDGEVSVLRHGPHDITVTITV